MKTLKLLSFILILFSVGCMSVQKASNYLDKKGKLAEVCAKTYPVQDSKIIIKERVTTDTVTDTSYIIVDTCNGKVIQKPCPPSKTITKTIYRDTTVYKRDRAYEQIQSDSIHKLNEIVKNQDEMIAIQEKQIKLLNKEAKDWRWKAVFTWILIGGAVALFIFRKFK